MVAKCFFLLHFWIDLIFLIPADEKSIQKIKEMTAFLTAIAEQLMNSLWPSAINCSGPQIEAISCPFVAKYLSTGYLG